MKKALILFPLFGMVYAFVEVLFTALSHKLSNFPYYAFEGETSLWMFLVGGLSILLIGLLNQVNWLRVNINVFWASVIGSFIITLLEFISGVILNLWLGCHIWDYSNLPFNILGQISLPFMLIWLFVTPAAIWLDDVLRFYLYGQGKLYPLSLVYFELFNVTGTPQFQGALRK